MNEKETSAYIEELKKYGSLPGLTNIRNLCEKLGHPERELSFVHIAGTNGKGSTLSFLSEVLKCAGFKVGKYVSPTISDYRERIQVNDRMISKRSLSQHLHSGILKNRNARSSYWKQGLGESWMPRTL